MSSTQNGARKHTYDFFQTPEFCISALATMLSCDRVYVDAGAGIGNIGRELLRAGMRRVHMVEVDERNLPALHALAAKYPDRAVVHHADFLEWTPPERIDVTVMNPPFKLWEGADGVRGFIDRSQAIDIPVSYTLARWNWLAPVGRWNWRLKWNRTHPNHGHILTRRPAFIAVTKYCDGELEDGKTCRWRGVASRTTKSIVHDGIRVKDDADVSSCPKMDTAFKSADQADSCEYAWLQHDVRWPLDRMSTYNWLECESAKAARRATTPRRAETVVA